MTRGRAGARARRPRLAALIVDDVLRGVGSRPWRSFFCAFGVFVAAAALVLVVGLSGANEARVSALFDADRSRYVLVRTPPDGSHELSLTDLRDAGSLPVLAAVSPGVSVAGVSAWALPPATAGRTHGVTVVGTDEHVAAAAGLELQWGTGFDAGHVVRGDRVVLLGRAVAERLHVAGTPGDAVVFLEGRPYAVIGVFEHAAADPGLAGAMLVPRSALPLPAGQLPRSDAIDVVYALAADQQTGVAASWLTTRLAPVHPERLQVSFDRGAGQVARRVSAQLARLTLLLAAAGGVVSALMVATVMTSSVTERTGEIGLRRALGAHPAEIVGLLLLEGGLLGTVGAAAGVSAGIAALLAVTSASSWPFVLPVTVPWLALGQGTVVGTVASLLAAVRAARLDPHLALTAR